MTDMNEDITRNYIAIRDEIKKNGIAEMITTASRNVTITGNHRDVDEWSGKKPGESVDMDYIHVSENYFNTVGMSMKEGRNFSNPDRHTECESSQRGCIKLLRLKNPINQTITYIDTRLKIIGVVKDALMASPFSPADPTVIL